MTIESRSFHNLERAEKYLNLAVQAGDISVWGYDVQNDRMYDIAGDIFEEDGLPLSKASEEVYPDDRERLGELMDKMMRGESNRETICIRYRNYHTGEFEYIQKEITTILDSSGNVSQIVGTHRNISDDIKYRQEKERLISALSVAVNASEIFIIYYDVAEDIVYSWKNGEFVKSFFSITRMYELLHPDEKEEFAALFDKLVKGKRNSLKKTYRLFNQRWEEYRYYEVKLVTVKNEDGKVIRITGSQKDVTDMKMMMDRIEEADRMKSEFVANMSHEIRTPINAIVGFTQLLKDAETKEEKEEYYEIISRNSKMLLEIINGVLDISRIESGKIDLKNEKIDISDVFTQTYASLKQRNTKPDLDFLCDIPYKKCIVEMDKLRLVQIITNFVTNAFKFTEAGYVLIGYTYVDKGVRIYCEDTGIGMDEDVKEKVFDRFFKTTSNNPGGTGLGMPICKAIIDAKKGEIGVDSEPGKGSTFWAWFPSARYDE